MKYNCLYKLLIILTFFVFFEQTAIGAFQGKIDYSIPIDYTNINEQELVQKAEYYYPLALSNTTGNVDDNTTSALNLYGILSCKNPENITYTLRMGKLYENIKKDRYAKGCYLRAIGIAPQNPEPYFYLGEFYSNRDMHRKALKYYKEAYSKGYQNHPGTIIRLKETYRRLGDYKGLESLAQ